MTRSLNRLTAALLVAFLIMAASVVYWSVFASGDLLRRSQNPRNIEFEQTLRRGAIYDRNGQVLAQTIDAGQSGSGKVLARRDYPQPDALSAIGYYSLAQGGILVHGGIEEAFDSTLRGDDQLDAGQRALNDLLHHPQIGSDVRLTLDLPLQSAIVTALKSYNGAVIVVDVPSGAVRAMVSVPSFNPATLDQTFAQLLKDPSAPLVNRVIQGTYQPGSALETVVLSALLTDKVPLDSAVVATDTPLQFDDLMLPCNLNGASPTLQNAYAMDCPQPFALAAFEHRANVQQAIEAFGLLRPPALAHFKTQTGVPPSPLYALADDKVLLGRQGAGQGSLTVTPLQMAIVTATVANHGNAVSLHMADATRPPGSTSWQPLNVAADQPAVTSQSVATLLRTAMRAAVTNGTAHAADRDGLTIYGHASFALSGPKNNAISWFIGFVDLPNGNSIATAVVLENTRDPPAAALIGGAALQASVGIK